jgi:iron(III) transport system permease protein
MASYLTPWRWAAALLLLLLVGAPLLGPFAESVREGIGAWSAADGHRLVHLFQQTLLLIVGVLALALPIGVALAVLLFRTEFPGRSLLFCLTFVMLFVPLPTITSAWQALLGSDGWLPLMLWGENAGRPWTTGMGPAIWVHFLAGLPWVIFFVGLGLSWVERELEEEGLLLGPPLWVLWRITLPRCRGVIVFAAVWLSLHVAGEITVTDMMLVATFAEEVQTQFTLGDREGLARAVIAASPIILATWGFLVWYVPRLERHLPPLQMRFAEPRRFALGPSRWALTLLIALLLLTLFGIPLSSLLWKLGQAGHPAHWSAANAWRHFHHTWHLHGPDVWANVLLAAAAGATVSLLALALCWLTNESRWLRFLLIAVITLAWALPGPIVGIGLKETIALLPEGVLADALYFGPSPLPLAWAYLVRFLPFAVALLWPVVRMVPRELREAARLEGQGPWREFLIVTWPLTRSAVVLCGALVAALALGEVAASTRVETPGWESFAKLVFDRMHYGVDNNVAALSLVLLSGILAVALVTMLAWRLPFRARGESPQS